MSTYTFIGASGETYTHEQINPHGQLPPLPGVSIFAKSIAGEITPIYVGETESLAHALLTECSWVAAVVQGGVDQLYYHQELDRRARLAEWNNLVERYRPKMNGLGKEVPDRE